LNATATLGFSKYQSLLVEETQVSGIRK